MRVTKSFSEWIGTLTVRNVHEKHFNVVFECHTLHFCEAKFSFNIKVNEDSSIINLEVDTDVRGPCME